MNASASRARGMAADERPRARQRAAARGLRGAGHQLRPRPGAPPAGAQTDVDGRARRGAGNRPCQRDRGRRRPRIPEARAPAAASHRPAGQARRGDAQRQGAWPGEPTRSSARRRRRSAPWARTTSKRSGGYSSASPRGSKGRRQNRASGSGAGSCHGVRPRSRRERAIPGRRGEASASRRRP